MEFGTPSQINILVYVSAYIFVIAGLIWVTAKPKKTKKTKKTEKSRKRPYKKSGRFRK